MCLSWSLNAGKPVSIPKFKENFHFKARSKVIPTKLNSNYKLTHAHTVALELHDSDRPAPLREDGGGGGVEHH